MNLKEFRKQQKELEKQISAHGKKMLVEEFKEFFDNNPEIGAIRWTQYTPFFNDGEPCEFSRHEFMVKMDLVGSLKEDSEYVEADEDDYEDGFMDSWSKELGPNTKKALEKLEKTFDETTEDLFRASFGDGYQITATRDGFDVVEYDHD